MSTRYVWGRYEFSTETRFNTQAGSAPLRKTELYDSITGLPINPNSDKTLYYAIFGDATTDYRDGLQVSGFISSETIDLSDVSGASQIRTIGYGNAGIFSVSPISQNVTIVKAALRTLWDDDVLEFMIQPTEDPLTIRFHGGGYYWRETEIGAFVSDVSGSSQSSYPSDGVQGSYWYTYQGSDNIDPTAVTYPSGPKSGVPITITVTPRANTYGGTISYQYEYTLDGGNVWNQLALTTAASRQYTIPKGTQTFRVRVQARDNMGFTSSDWIYGPQVNVVNNSAPSAPPTITVPVSPRGGAQTTITWTASSDVDGNLAGYELERQLDGGSWTSLYTGAGLSYLDTIPKGTATAAYRVRAYDADGDYSGYTTSATRTVVNNNPPVITSSLSGDLGTKSAGFTVPYTVTDEEGGAVTVVEQVGNLVKRTHTPTLGQEQTFHVEDQDGDYFFTQILNGPQTVRITATDEGGLSSTLELPFTKAVHSMSVTLETPLEVEEAITVAIMSVLCGIPADASYQLLATNNAKDAEPVWQDVTADVAAGRNIIFTNQVQANGPAFNFKLSASRSEGGQGGYVKSLKGAFQ